MTDGDSYPRTDRTTPTRHADRARYDRESVHAILDHALIGHLSFSLDGAPGVLPLLFVRVDSRIYLHQSSGARLARACAAGPVPVALSVAEVDGLVLARSWMNHSLNYRSVVAQGPLRLVADPVERWDALAATVDKVVAGRATVSREPNAKELAATAVLALDLLDVSAKVRSGPVVDDEDDLALPWWAGVVDVNRAYGPVHSASSPDVPAAVRALLAE
ncbi:MAG: pyridoxamine 5'-phosphate oxidase family protein [Candidatus Nanopelagicales bacterium]